MNLKTEIKIYEIHRYGHKFDIFFQEMNKKPSNCLTNNEKNIF